MQFALVMKDEAFTALDDTGNFFFQEMILKMLWGVRDISLEMIFLGLGLSSWVNKIGTDRKKRTIEDEFTEVGGRAEKDIGQQKMFASV